MERDAERIKKASTDGCRAMLASLEANEAKLHENMSRYPIEVSSTELRYVLDKNGDLDWLMEQLRARIEEEDAHIAVMPAWAQGVLAETSPTATGRRS